MSRTAELGRTGSPDAVTDRDPDGADMRRAIRELGHALTPELLKGSQVLYAPFHPVEVDGMVLHADLAYGPHERNRLDLLVPSGTADAVPGRGLPILLYVHGGGFTRGDKKVPGLPYFHNIGRWAASRGIVGALMTYRLAPEHLAPAGQQDIAAAIAWLQREAGAFGGDPDRIVLVGHSAGAVLAACHLATMAAEPAEGLRGAVLMSGYYDFARLADSGSAALYFGAEFARQAPISGLQRSRVPVMVSVAEWDPHDFQDQALALISLLFTRDGRLPRFVRQTGQNHYTAAFRIGAGGPDPFERELDDFLSEVCDA